MNIRQKMRASHVKRWHIVETSRQQSIAEHMYNVYLLTEEIMKICEYGLPVTDWQNMITYALQHDLDEVITGDIPTPAKLGMYPSPGLSLPVLRPEIKFVVKVADMMEAIIFLQLYGIGKHAYDVRERIIMDMRRYISYFPLPVEYLFIKNATMDFTEDVIKWNTAEDAYYDDGYGDRDNAASS